MTRIILICTLALSACTSIPGVGNLLHSGELKVEGGERVYYVRHDLGGEARTQYDLWHKRQEDHRPDRFAVDGMCVSMCAYMMLASRDTCYTKNATLGIHPSSYMGARTGKTRRFDAEVVAAWPQPMQDWWHKTTPSVLGVDLKYTDLKEIWPEGECK